MINNNISVNQKKYLQLCTGCGICAAACSKNALRMKLSPAGLMRPSFKQEKECNECGICTKVCTGYKQPDNSTKNTTEKNDSIIGRSYNAYQGHASEGDIRRGGASGGLVTAILANLLKSSSIRGA